MNPNRCYPLAAASLGLLLAGTFMPSPLYQLYQREWGLTPGAVSLVFAIYGASLIPSLLFLGGISDQIGRRNTLQIAFAFAAAGSLVFAFASGFWSLVAARVLQGVAIGIGTPTATAAIREWMPAALRPRAGSVAILGVSIGSSFGALLAGSLAQYAPLPTTLPYLIHVALLALLAVLVAAVATCPHLAPAAHQTLPTIPRAVRRPFFLASAESFIGWATFAIFVSLLPSFLARSLDIHNLLLGAFVVTCLQAGMLAASFVGRGVPNRAAIVIGMIGLVLGVWLLLIAVPYHFYAVMGMATLLVGLGGGFAYLAGLNIVNAVAPEAHRAELLSAFFVACYVGFSVPALGVGLIANRIGLYSAIVGAAFVLSAVAAATLVATTPRNLTVAPEAA